MVSEAQAFFQPTAIAFAAGFSFNNKQSGGLCCLSRKEFSNGETSREECVDWITRKGNSRGPSTLLDVTKRGQKRNGRSACRSGRFSYRRPPRPWAGWSGEEILLFRFLCRITATFGWCLPRIGRCLSGSLDTVAGYFPSVACRLTLSSSFVSVQLSTQLKPTRIVKHIVKHILTKTRSFQDFLLSGENMRSDYQGTSLAAFSLLLGSAFYPLPVGRQYASEKIFCRIRDRPVVPTG
jgi:hypothetical protein